METNIYKIIHTCKIWRFHSDEDSSHGVCVVTPCCGVVGYQHFISPCSLLHGEAEAVRSSKTKVSYITIQHHNTEDNDLNHSYTLLVNSSILLWGVLSVSFSSCIISINLIICHTTTLFIVSCTHKDVGLILLGTQNCLNGSLF